VLPVSLNVTDTYVARLEWVGGASRDTQVLHLCYAPIFGDGGIVSHSSSMELPTQPCIRDGVLGREIGDLSISPKTYCCRGSRDSSVMRILRGRMAVFAAGGPPLPRSAVVASFYSSVSHDKSHLSTAVMLRIR